MKTKSISSLFNAISVAVLVAFASNLSGSVGQGGRSWGYHGAESAEKWGDLGADKKLITRAGQQKKWAL